MKRSPFKRKPTWKKLKPISKKRNLALKIYSKLRREYLISHPICCICWIKKADQIHHKKGRGIYLNFAEYWLPVCSLCHRYIEDNRKEAREKGYLLDRIGRKTFPHSNL